MNKMKGIFGIGIDFGATQIKIGAVTRRGKVVLKKVISTPKQILPRQFVRMTAKEIVSLLKGCSQPRQCYGIGIGVPGLVNSDRGLVEYLVNVKGWKKVPLARLMQRQMKLKVRVDNDVNAMTLGELKFGAGRGCRNLVCLTLGTGVGGGIVIHGELYRGATYSAGEIGHVVVEKEGRPCACGGIGCLEAYVGNRRIVEQARAMIEGKSSLLNQWVQKGEPLSPKLISQAARRGDLAAQAVWKEVGAHLGVALTSVVNLLNPERIIIGGGVANTGTVLFEVIRKTVRQRAMKGPADSVKIVKAELGEDAGIVGAAMLI